VLPPVSICEDTDCTDAKVATHVLKMDDAVQRTIKEIVKAERAHGSDSDEEEEEKDESAAEEEQEEEEEEDEKPIVARRSSHKRQRVVVQEEEEEEEGVEEQKKKQKQPRVAAKKQPAAASRITVGREHVICAEPTVVTTEQAAQMTFVGYRQLQPDYIIPGNKLVQQIPDCDATNEIPCETHTHNTHSIRVAVLFGIFVQSLCIFYAKYAQILQNLRIIAHPCLCVFVSAEIQMCSLVISQYTHTLTTSRSTPWMPKTSTLSNRGPCQLCICSSRNR
jgi:hypothetical protein